MAPLPYVRRLTTFCVLSLLYSSCEGSPLSDQDEYHPRGTTPRGGVPPGGGRVDWNQLALAELDESIRKVPQIGVAKNVIIFIGDGMGLSDVTASRFLLAERLKQPVYETKLSFEKFPHVGLSKTHPSDRQTADSASSATGILCGEKTNYFTIGVDDKVAQGDCTHVNTSKLRSALKYSMDAGKRVGFVTTTRVTHATPASAYAHTADRDAEANTVEGTIHPENCPDVAWQLIHGEGNAKINVAMGGGREMFYSTVNPSSIKLFGHAGSRTDQRDLIKDWHAIKRDSGLQEDKYVYVTNKTQFDDVDPDNVDYLLGLFQRSHMSFDLERNKTSPDQEPSLADMTAKALKILQRGDRGYFLLVEGGRIDHGHHDNLAHQALGDTLAFELAIQSAVDMTSEEETLIVVTADHSHVFAMAGYAPSNQSIFGTDSDDVGLRPQDGLPYTTLTYINGPGYHEHREVNGSHHYRKNLTGVDTTADDFVFDAGIPSKSETHGGEDVAIYARGPMSYLFDGIHAQHFIAHALMYASCIGPNRKLCDGPLPTLLPRPPATAPIVPMASVASKVSIVTSLTLCSYLALLSTLFMLS